MILHYSFVKEIKKKKRKLKDFLILFFMIVSVFGCPSRDEVEGPIETISSGDIVKFRINSDVNGNSLNVYFRPDVSVKVYSILCEAPTYTITVNMNPNLIYSKNDWHFIDKFDFFASGEQWNFKFDGTLAVSGIEYKTTTIYLIP